MRLINIEVKTKKLKTAPIKPIPQKSSNQIIIVRHSKSPTSKKSLKDSIRLTHNPSLSQTITEKKSLKDSIKLTHIPSSYQTIIKSLSPISTVKVKKK